MGYLQNITRQKGGGQLGGILTIEVARKDEVQSIPEAVKGVVYGNVVMKAGASFVRWAVSQQSAGFESPTRVTREGTSKDNSLNFYLPLDRDDVRAMLETAESDEFIVVYKYPNGKSKIFGTKSAPVRFSFNHASGTKNNEGNGNNCRFYYSGPDNTYFYEGSLTSSPGPAPAVVYLNGVAIASLTPGETLSIVSPYTIDYFIIS